MHSLAMVYEYVVRQKTGTYPKRVTLVSRDIKGAFDRLDHRRVKYHLYHIGTPPVLCKALSSFLDDRTARIRVGGITGPAFQLLAGSPQGAAPSAKLFTLVTRNAPVGRNSNFYNTHYADDCLQIVATQGESINFHGRDIKSAISEMNDFEAREGLITEPSKSCLVPIGHMYCPEINVGGAEYRTTEKPVSFLGLDITKFSMINPQVRKQARKGRAVLSSLHKFSMIKTKLKINLVKTLVLPYLFYPPIPLHLASNNQMRKLQSVQNDSIRFAHGIQWDEFISNKRLHTELKSVFRPVNQELFWRAKKTWDSIRNEGAGDPGMLEVILGLEMDFSQKKRSADIIKYPSSYNRIITNGAEPAPFYG